jgi:hypothetical protein
MLKHSDTAAFEARGLDAEVADRLNCRFENGKFVFEYRSMDALSFRKIRTQDKHFWIEPAGSPLHLWNIDSLRGLGSRPQSALTLTEGEFDSIAVYQACGGFVASVPNGANGQKSEGAIRPNQDNGFQYLWGPGGKLLPELEQFDKIILATDADEKGFLLRDELAIRLGEARCWFVEYPDKCKDANDTLREYGAETLAKVIANAKPMRPGYLVSARDIPPRRMEVTYSTGWGFLDPRVRIIRPELMVITGQPGHGKALALDTEVPTENGWTTMGNIKVGDRIFDENGDICNVTRVSEVHLGRPCYRIKFDDGTEIVADEGHQWLTSTRAARISAWDKLKHSSLKPHGTDQTHKRTFPSVVTTGDIARTLTTGSPSRKNHQIELIKPLQMPGVCLPIDPYTLGVWLGDGNSTEGGFTCFDEEILSSLEAIGQKTTPRKKAGKYGLVDLKPKLRIAGLLGNKRIPKPYFRSSFQQRLSLLQGLMDTDGTCMKDRRCELTTIKEGLAVDVYELSCSLGLKVTLTEGRATIDGRDISAKYRVCFVAPDFPVFTVKRKLERQGVGTKHRTANRTIISCEPVPSIPVRCIQVDSPSHLFLVTRSFVPTHNSLWMRALTFHLAESHGWRIGYLTPEDPPHRLVRDMRRFAGRCVSRRSDPSWVDSAFYISQPPEDEPITLEMVENEMAAAALHHDCQAFVIDPWNEISHNYGRLSTDQYIEQSLRTLKRKARRYNMLLIIVAHPTKLDEEKKATLYTINGSANWRNKCDHGIIIHRPFLDAHGIHVIVEKCKDHETMGIPGTHFMRYIKDECEFVDDQQLQ